MSNDKKEITTPMKAIKAKCLDCCCNQHNEVKLCTAKDCALWPFRLGHSPFRAKRELTEEQKRKVAETFAKAKAKRVAK